MSPSAGLVAAAALLAAACPASGPPSERAPEAPVAPAPVVRPLAVPEEDPEHPLPTVSIYDLELALTDQHGSRVGLDTFAGHPTLVTMFYASCPAACPRLVDDLLAIEQALPADRRAALRVLVVSFDAARDTPERLAELARQRGLDPARWRLAAAGDDGARELAAVLGVKYRVLDDGEYFHTSVITLVDAAGVPEARIEGLGRSPEPILRRLRPPR